MMKRSGNSSRLLNSRSLKYIVSVIIALTTFSTEGFAQFKEEAFTQTYNERGDSTAVRDTADKLFSFKEYFGALAHKNTMKPGTMFAGSVILPGTAQIYNKDYWKLPIIYGGIGSLAGTGGYYLHKYQKSKSGPEPDLRAKTTGTWLMVGAGLFYWGSMLDGVVCYESKKKPDPGRATLYSILLPGLGQIYNGELFKVPIYWGCLLGSVHFLTTNNTNYVRFKRIHNEATTNPNYDGQITGETAQWYRNVYRRYRDYSIVATALFYLLQVIDANVFAYMHDFEVSDDISLDISPAVIAPDNAYAIHTPNNWNGQNAVGLRLGFTF